jgi:hypothetical protein
MCDPPARATWQPENELEAELAEYGGACVCRRGPVGPSACERNRLVRVGGQHQQLAVPLLAGRRDPFRRDPSGSDRSTGHAGGTGRSRPRVPVPESCLRPRGVAPCARLDRIVCAVGEDSGSGRARPVLARGSSESKRRRRASRQVLRRAILKRSHSASSSLPDFSPTAASQSCVASTRARLITTSTFPTPSHAGSSPSGLSIRVRQDRQTRALTKAGSRSRLSVRWLGPPF